MSLIKIFLNFVLLFNLSSCAYFNKVNVSHINLLQAKKESYSLVDRDGRFVVERKKDFKKQDKQFFLRKTVRGSSSGKVLEKHISISDLGIFKKQEVLRPKLSQYSVWFDGKKYFSEIKLDYTNRRAALKMVSPEEQWDGVKYFTFPNDGSKLICFFEQLPECLTTVSFIDKSIKKGAGRIQLFILWGGYPYFQEQYLNLSDNIFSSGTVQYDGVSKNGDYRFTLATEGHSIFFFVNEDGNLVKKFWVSQGMSMTKTETFETTELF